MGHYSDDYADDEERRRKEQCADLRRWIKSRIDQIDNPTELKMIHEIATRSKEFEMVLWALKKISKDVA